MDIQEFVTEALSQLEAGLSKATRKSGEKRFVFQDAVKFDLAVTKTTSKEGDGGAKAKADIKIVEFEVGGKGKIATGQEVVQRIQFSVNVWPKETDAGVVDSQPHRPLFDLNERF